jgi:hypothetical protein
MDYTSFDSNGENGSLKVRRRERAQLGTTDDAHVPRGKQRGAI